MAADAVISQKEATIKLVKACLMKAWRDRSSEIKWGIQLKHILSSNRQLPDTGELADLILQQALVGMNPNALVLSYLRYAVSSHVISYGAAFRGIIKYEDYSKHNCIVGLIELAEELATKLSFSYGSEAALSLARSLLKLLHWLLLCILKHLEKIGDAKQSQECGVIMEKASSAVKKTLESSTVRVLLFIAGLDNTDIQRDLEQAEVNVRGTVTQIPHSMSAVLRENVLEALTYVSKIQQVQIDPQPVLDVSSMPLCVTVNTLVSIETILNPINDAQSFVEQLHIIKRLLRLSRPQLCCELFRACFMGLSEATGGQEDLKCAAFTCLKLPQVLLQLQDESPNFSHDLEQGIDQLLNYVPLLDLTDSKTMSDSLDILLSECVKVQLLNEAQCRKLKQRRIQESRKSATVNLAPSNQQPITSLIMRAEPTVHSILKTLDAEYSKNQEALLGVLCHMLSGKSFELILTAAAATGKLLSFATKLVRFNEFAKQSQGESSTGAMTRALLFDITFLMLSHIAQIYGFELLMSCPDCADSFFVTWANKCLPEDGKYKSTESNCPTDPNKVDILLNQFYTGGELKMSLQRWHEVCTNAPFAIQEIVYAWEAGVVSPDKVHSCMDNVKRTMCCLPVVIAAGVCSYMNIVGEGSRHKPLAILQRLTKIIQTDGTQGSQLYYSERSNLMVTILKKMMNDILPISQRETIDQYIPADILPITILEKTLKQIFSAGWMNLKGLHTLEQLLTLCGTDWFCERVVLQMLDSTRPEDLLQMLSHVVAIFHMDLEALTLSLLLYTIPNFLQLSRHLHLLADPTGYTLAKLTVMCISATRAIKLGQKTSLGFSRRAKRTRKEVDIDDFDDYDVRPSKMRRLQEQDAQEITLHSEGFNLELLSTKEDGEMSPSYDTKDTLNRALVNLFRMFSAVACENQVSPRTSFTIAFISEAVRCGPLYSRFILQFMSPNMVSQLMKSIPDVFTDQQLLHICDLSTNMGRKMAAKTICQNARYHKQCNTT